MRVLVILLASLAAAAANAETDWAEFRSTPLGVAFSYPADWDSRVMRCGNSFMNWKHPIYDEMAPDDWDSEIWMIASKTSTRDADIPYSSVQAHIHTDAEGFDSKRTQWYNQPDYPSPTSITTDQGVHGQRWRHEGRVIYAFVHEHSRLIIVFHSESETILDAMDEAAVRTRFFEPSRPIERDSRGRTIIRGDGFRIAHPDWLEWRRPVDDRLLPPNHVRFEILDPDIMHLSIAVGRTDDADWLNDEQRIAEIATWHIVEPFVNNANQIGECWTMALPNGPDDTLILRAYVLRDQEGCVFHLNFNAPTDLADELTHEFEAIAATFTIDNPAEVTQDPATLYSP